MPRNLATYGGQTRLRVPRQGRVERGAWESTAYAKLMGEEACARQTSWEALAPVRAVEQLERDRREAAKERRRMEQLLRDLRRPPERIDARREPSAADFRGLGRFGLIGRPVPGSVAAAPVSPTRSKKLFAAVGFLRASLSEGPRAASELYAEARRLKICSERTLWAAKERLGVEDGRWGFGPGSVPYWKPPPPAWEWVPAYVELHRLWRERARGRKQSEPDE